MPSIDDFKKATVFLEKQLSASIRIHIVKHPEDSQFDARMPCFRVTLKALDPDTNKVEADPQWKDLSADASAEESTFVIKAEKLASLPARIFKRRKPRKLDLKIQGAPLPAWQDMYEPLEQTEKIAAGDQTTVRLAFRPRQLNPGKVPGSDEPPKANKFNV